MKQLTNEHNKIREELHIEDKSELRTMIEESKLDLRSTQMKLPKLKEHVTSRKESQKFYRQRKVIALRIAIHLMFA